MSCFLNQISMATMRHFHCWATHAAVHYLEHMVHMGTLKQSTKYSFFVLLSEYLTSSLMKREQNAHFMLRLYQINMGNVKHVQCWAMLVYNACVVVCNCIWYMLATQRSTGALHMLPLFSPVLQNKYLTSWFKKKEKLSLCPFCATFYLINIDNMRLCQLRS